MLILSNQWKQASKLAERVINLFPLVSELLESWFQCKWLCSRLIFLFSPLYTKSLLKRIYFPLYPSSTFPLSHLLQTVLQFSRHSSDGRLHGRKRGWEFQLYSCCRNTFRPHLHRNGHVTLTRENGFKNGGRLIRLVHPCISGTWHNTWHTVRAPQYSYFSVSASTPQRQEDLCHFGLTMR